MRSVKKIASKVHSAKNLINFPSNFPIIKSQQQQKVPQASQLIKFQQHNQQKQQKM
jgi:hypothetical protein